MRGSNSYSSPNLFRYYKKDAHTFYITHIYTHMEIYVFMCVCIYTYLFTGKCKIKKKNPPRSRLVCKVAMQKKNSGRLEQKDKKIAKYHSHSQNIYLPLCTEIKTWSSFWSFYYFLICRSAKACLYSVSAANTWVDFLLIKSLLYWSGFYDPGRQP